MQFVGYITRDIVYFELPYFLISICIYILQTAKKFMRLGDHQVTRDSVYLGLPMGLSLNNVMKARRPK